MHLRPGAVHKRKIEKKKKTNREMVIIVEEPTWMLYSAAHR